MGDFGLAREGAEYKMEMEDEVGDRRKVLLEISFNEIEVIK